MKILNVMYSQTRVGTLEQMEDGTIGFTYTNQWLKAEQAWPVSQTIPLRSGTNFSAEVQRFF